MEDDESFFNLRLEWQWDNEVLRGYRSKTLAENGLIVSGLKFIFHWVAQLLILSKSLLELFAKVWMSCITENKDESSAKSFALDEKPSVRSLMQIKNNEGPSMEPWGNQLLTFSYKENCLLRTTRCFLSFKKSRQKFSKSPGMPFWVRLKIIPSYHTLSNAFEISRNTLLTSRPSSKELYITWVIIYSWLMQESPSLKPDWLEWRSLFSMKNSKILLNVNLSRIFPEIGSSDAER